MFLFYLKKRYEKVKCNIIFAIPRILPNPNSLKNENLVEHRPPACHAGALPIELMPLKTLRVGRGINFYTK